ncbi:MAG: tetratricopeptide repeat protein [Bryobacteraceae bacterium]
MTLLRLCPAHAAAVLVLTTVLAASCSFHLSRLRPAKRRQPMDPQSITAQTAVARATRRQVRNAVDAGEGDYLARQLRARLAADPADLDARLELASHYEAAGFPDLALEHFRLAADRFPQDEQVAIRLARSLRSQGFAADGARSLGRFLEANPDASFTAWSWAGILHDEAGLLIDGEEFHRQATYRAPTAYAFLHNNLGQNLQHQNRPADAAAEFRRALRLEPRSEIARNNLAIALSSDLREALLHMQSVADPTTAHNNLAAVLIEQGRYREARVELNLALGYQPGNAAALRNLAILSELDGLPAVFKSKQRASRNKGISQNRR